MVLKFLKLEETGDRAALLAKRRGLVRSIWIQTDDETSSPICAPILR
ncbi:hypothetical protein [Rhodomicrobium udaipurense]|uniref:Uncharacterized protein n=1 Tax=Rhodomicrobium udaipurense TaxID=1202716 RepID=A0A8I1GDD2_9HYPH|nr:hypothetical protein [Rhodomicrobium udaipurense]MBJ7543810.1 hypothetical protein [Rhodomicrobium udaipurense]